MTHQNGDESEAYKQALLYASRGWPVLPVWGINNGLCRCPKGTDCKCAGKHPRTSDGVHAASTAPTVIARWKWGSANIGIATGEVSDLLVIDVDPRNDGDATLARLVSQLGDLPDGPVVVTGGGGLHYYFKWPVLPTIKPNHWTGIDIKGNGGFVVAPPSQHRSGGKYRWKGPGYSEIGQVGPGLPSLPATWLTALTKRECNTDGSDNADGTDCITTAQTTEGRSALVSSFVKGAIRDTIPSAKGQRHARVFRFARLLKGHPAIGTCKLSDLRPYVDQWYDEVVKHLGQENVQASADDNWFDFAEGWGKIRRPGWDIVETALERAKTSVPPSVAQSYRSDSVRLLIAFCKEMHLLVGRTSFYLSTETAMRVLGETQRTTPWRILNGLVLDGVLERVDRGDPKTRHAASFIYRGD